MPGLWCPGVRIEAGIGLSACYFVVELVPLAACCAREAVGVVHHHLPHLVLSLDAWYSYCTQLGIPGWYRYYSIS